MSTLPVARSWWRILVFAMTYSAIMATKGSGRESDETPQFPPPGNHLAARWFLGSYVYSLRVDEGPKSGILRSWWSWHGSGRERDCAVALESLMRWCCLNTFCVFSLPSSWNFRLDRIWNIIIQKERLSSVLNIWSPRRDYMKHFSNLRHHLRNLATPT